MPSFSDSIFLFVLALLLFGPKKLPMLARELGKWVGEFRRASNEFKMQMEEELRQAEQEDRKKQIAAMEAAAPVAQPVDSLSHPHLQEPAADGTTAPPAIDTASATPAPESQPLPIATSGDLKIMPPSTGLPTARAAAAPSSRSEDDPFGGGLLESIPSANGQQHADTTHADAANAVVAFAEGESDGR